MSREKAEVTEVVVRRVDGTEEIISMELIGALQKELKRKKETGTGKIVNERKIDLYKKTVAKYMDKKYEDVTEDDLTRIEWRSSDWTMEGFILECLDEYAGLGEYDPGELTDFDVVYESGINQILRAIDEYDTKIRHLKKEINNYDYLLERQLKRIDEAEEQMYKVARYTTWSDFEAHDSPRLGEDRNPFFTN